MSPSIFRLLLAVPWAAALFGTLQIHRLDLHLGHSICGPWGCGPPMEALIGYHSFWLVLIVPLAVVAGTCLPRSWRWWTGAGVLAVGLIGVFGYVSWDAFKYYANSQSTEYLLQRCFFSLVTNVDLPSIQVALAGLALFLLGRRGQASETEAPSAPAGRAADARDTSNPQEPLQVVAE